MIKKFSKDLIPLRPVQDKMPFTRSPRTNKRLKWRRRDSSQSLVKEMNMLQKKIDSSKEEED